MSTTTTPTPAELFSRFVVDLIRVSLEQIEEERASHPQPDGPGLFNREEAAKYLAVSGTTFDKLRRSGMIESVDVAGVPRYARRDLDRYIERLRKER